MELMQPGSLAEPTRKRLNAILQGLGSGGVFGTRAELVGGTVPSSTSVLITLGYATAGDGGGGCYVAQVSAPTYPGSYFQTADSRYWVYAPDHRGVNAKAFGAKADGTVNSSTRAFGGTDNWQVIQNALDFAFYGAQCVCYAPAGAYRVTDTLQQTYGETFRSSVFVGDGGKYLGSSGFVGTVILADFADRPAIAVNGARNSQIRDMAILGKNFHWIEGSNVLGAKPSTDDTVLTNWIDPTLLAGNPNINAQFTPYAAIAIDPYAGPQPPIHYPNVTFPAWSGISTQYGKSFSSGVKLENVWIGGFVVPLAIQPCNADGNGDFIKLKGVTALNNVYVISAGNSQGRCCSAEGCNFSGFHSGVVNGVHGKQKGELDLESVGTNWERCIQILDIADASLAGAFKFEGGRSESIWRIGNWNGATAVNCPLQFDSWTFHFSLQNDWRGHPRTILSAGEAPIKFTGCAFSNFPSVLGFGKTIDALGFSFDGACVTNSATTEVLTYRQLATNFLGGGHVLSPVSYDKRPEQFSMKLGRLYNIDTGLNDATWIKNYSLSDRRHPVCAWTAKARPSAQTPAVLDQPVLWFALGKTNAQITASSFSGTTLSLTFDIAARIASTMAKNGPLPGDVIWDDQTGIAFFVRSFDTGTGICLAEIQNAYKIVGGSFDANGNTTGGGTVTIESGVTLSLTAGNWYFGNARVFTMEYFFRGDTSTASAVITNCGRDDGFCSFIDSDSQLLVNDYAYIDDLADRWTSPTVALVTAKDGTAKTVTLNGVAARNLTIHRLPFWIRQPPANV